MTSQSPPLVQPALGIEKKQSYKMKKEKYHTEKRRVAKELISTFKDPTVVVMADWLKIRGTLRTWTKMYCVLKPGLLLIYKGPKTHKHGFWIGTILLSTCELIERPSKRDGFCFKLFHPLDQSIWATRGPQGENFGAVTQPLPTSYLICRAPCEESGRCWMDGLELALKCSSLLMRTMSRLQESVASSSLDTGTVAAATPSSPTATNGSSAAVSLSLNETSIDSHSFNEADMLEGKPLSDTEAERHFREAGFGDATLSDSEDEFDATVAADDSADDESSYEPSAPEVFGALGETEQTEEVGEENKSLIWTLMKQVRPGMDLSKVVLPTFILEPRSFLEKLADYYYHADLLTKAISEDDPFKRMKAVVKFYLSGFYKKPKGLKKPYNPVLGEKFRCFWQHPTENSRTFYVSQQVSHHPPISAFFASNRTAGFNVSGSILARSKFYGNSLSAIMVGSAKISLLTRGETYVVTLPYAHCKGLILGTLTMELGGTVSIVCDRTSYAAEIDFKLRPFLSGSDSMNACSGKIKLGKETLADLSGHWDSAIYLTTRENGEMETFWQPTPEIINGRLPRFEVPLKDQQEDESQRLWSKVTEAIKSNNQVAATTEKSLIEDTQRKKVKLRLETKEHFKPTLFDFDQNTGCWMYKHADYRPWDRLNDLRQYERRFVIKTSVHHPTPLVRTGSVNLSDILPVKVAEYHSDDSSEENQQEIGKVAKAINLRKKKATTSDLWSMQYKKQADEFFKPLNDEVVALRTKIDSLALKIDRSTKISGQSVESLRTQLFVFLALLVAFQAVLCLFFGSKFSAKIIQD